LRGFFISHELSWMFYLSAKTCLILWNGRAALKFIPNQPHKRVASEAVAFSACTALLNTA